jgi:hypothetical protein
MVKKGTEKNIMCFTPINETICTIILKGKFRNITLINVNAPTEEKTEEEKEGYDVRKDIQKIKLPNWKTLAQDRRRREREVIFSCRKICKT